PREVFMHIKKFRFSCLADEYKTPELESMYDWYCNALLERYVLLPSGEVTLQTKGNPSGQISTTMDNNLCNVFFQAFEFAYINPDLSMQELCDAWERCDSLIYGDDRLTTFPSIPSDYVNRVVDMYKDIYKDIFGMWVKPDKVVVQDTPIGLSFCGFTVNQDFMPVPTECDKLIASLVTPTKKLADIYSLYSKVLCYNILGYNLEDEHEFKNYARIALEVLARHIRNMGGEEPVHVTEKMLDVLWRGGPKRRDGSRQPSSQERGQEGGQEGSEGAC
ncbi:RNA-dependent RNA polymerase, partial [Mamastrovirus 11]